MDVVTLQTRVSYLVPINIFTCVKGLVKVRIRSSCWRKLSQFLETAVETIYIYYLRKKIRVLLDEKKKNFANKKYLCGETNYRNSTEERKSNLKRYLKNSGNKSSLKLDVVTPTG